MTSASGIIHALQKRAAGGGALPFGQGYDDPTAASVEDYVSRFGGDYGAAADAAWNEREKNRQRINSQGGESLLAIENQSRFGGGWLGRGNESDVQKLQVAMKLKNLAASQGKTQGGYAETPRPQATGQLGRMWERANQDSTAAVNRNRAYQRGQANADAQRLAVQQQQQQEWAERDRLHQIEMDKRRQIDQQNREAAYATASPTAPPSAMGALTQRRGR